MTWMSCLGLWLITGVVSAVWHIIDEWWHHQVFEETPGQIFLTNLIGFGLCLIAGPIGVAIKVWEKWFDPSNC